MHHSSPGVSNGPHVHVALVFVLSLLLLCCWLALPVSAADPCVPGPHSGNISTSQRWCATDSPHLVTGSIYINGGVTLTIEGGAVVQFNNGLFLDVQSGGMLVAAGTEAQPVLMQSSSGAPTKGIWRSVRALVGSHLVADYLTISHAGGVDTFALSLAASDATVRHSRILYSLTSGIYVSGAGTAPTIQDTEVAFCDGVALTQSVVDAVPAYTGMSLHDNGTNARVIPNGTIGRDVILDGSLGALGRAPMHVSSLIVPATRALTITTGSTLRFAAGTYITVQGGGALVAQGSAEAPIVLGPQGTPSAGAWRGLEFLTGASGDSAGQLAHVDIGYAGGVTGRSVFIGSSAVSLQDVQIHDGSGQGVLIEGEGRTPALTGVEIYRCSTAALQQVHLNTQPVLSGLNLHDNGTDAWVVAGGALNRDITVDGSLAALGGSPVYLGYAVVNTGYTLTVTAGTQVLFPVSGYVQVRTGGTLHAVGDPSAGVTFAGQTTGAGAWRLLEFQAGSTARLEQCDIASGGATYSRSLSILASDVQLRDCRIHDGTGTAIWIQGTGIAPVLERLEIDHNSGKAVHQSVFNMSPVYSDVYLHDNGTDSVTIDGVSQLTQSVTLDSVGYLNGAPYDLPLNSSGGTGAVLNVMPGTTLRMGGILSMYPGAQLWAEGTPTLPITITSLGAIPAPGQWGYIDYRAGSSGAMAYCDVGYGGAGWDSYSVRIDDPDVRLEHCTIHHSLGHGLVVWLFEEGDGPWIAYNTIAHNGTQGIHANSIHPSTVFVHNAIYDNGGYAIYNGDPSSDILDARNHYWGHPSGPYHPMLNPTGLGGQVSDNVLFYPWLANDAELNSTVAPVLVAPAPDSTLTGMPLQFQLVSADPDPWQQLTYTVEISRSGVLEGSYDGSLSLTGWDRSSYSPGVTATLTLPDVLPNAVYSWRGAVSDGYATEWSTARSFTVSWAGSFAVTGLEHDSLLSARDAPVLVGIRGAGFAAGSASVAVRRTLWDGSVQTIPVQSSEVLSSGLISATLDTAGVSGPWQVVVTQGALSASTPLYVWPWMTLFGVEYVNPAGMAPDRAQAHTLTVRNGGSADGVAVVGVWAPHDATLTVAAQEGVQYLGVVAGRAHLLAVQAGAGVERQVELAWRIPWSAVNPPGSTDPLKYNLADPLRWRFAGLGQVPVPVWQVIQAQAPGDVEQQVYLALWAGALLEGHAADAYLEPADDAAAKDYVERLGEVYPSIAGALVTRQVYDFEQAMYAALDMQIPGASGAASLAPDRAVTPAGWTEDVVKRLIGDPWEFTKQIHMWMYDLLVEDTYGTDPRAQATGFLIAEGSGILNGYAWGMWEPTLGASVYQHVYGLDPGTVAIGQTFGQWLSIPLTWAGRIPIKGLTAGLRFSNPVITPAGATWSTVQDAAIGSALTPYRWDHSWTAPGSEGAVVQWSGDSSGFGTWTDASTTEISPYYGGSESLWALETTQPEYVEGDPVYTANDAVPRTQNGTPWLHVDDLSDLQVSITISEMPVNEWAKQAGGAGDQPLPPPPAQTRAACTYGSSELRASWDPNSIEGAPRTSHIRPTQSLEYTVRFENLPEATAPAENVTVTMHLDANLDWDSLELGGASRPDLVRLRSDEASRSITWVLEGIHLLPNVSPPEGEGWVRLTVSPAAGLVTGDQAGAQAEIYFDTNPAIETNVLTHTIDLMPPSATVVVDGVTPVEALVTVSATDNAGGSGVANVAVQVSTDGLDWMTAGVLMVDPATETATGSLGRSLLGGHYLVRAVASDAVANVGAPSLLMEMDVPAGSRVFLPLVRR